MLTPSVLDYYNARLSATQNITQHEKDGRILTLSGDGAASVKSLVLSRGDEGPDIDVVATGDPVTLTPPSRPERRCRNWFSVTPSATGLGRILRYQHLPHRRSHWSRRCWGANQGALPLPYESGRWEYSITTAVVAGETHLDRNHEWCDLAKVFTVINANKKAFTGFVWLEPEVAVEVVR